MQNIDSFTHVRGESLYLDDLPIVNGTLYACVFGSPVAHGRIRSLDLADARNLPGVVRILTARDIPGENQIGGIIPDEVLLADQTVDFWGMPIALVVAETDEIARRAATLIRADIDPLPVVTDPREACALGQLIVPPRTFQTGDAEAAFADCDYIFEGRADSGGQEHLYLETQGAYAIPLENGNIRLFSSTQGPTAVQRAVARVLGLGMHKIEIDVTRLGGGFGGKEDGANLWAALVALATHCLRRPVKYVLHRMEDLRMTGKRHPYTSDFKIGLTKDLKIRAYTASLYQDAGASADLSPAVLERSLFHANNTYFIPNLRVTAYSCRTNLPSNTAFRGFGGPQGMFVIEAAIAKAAEELGVSALDIQRANLLREGDAFHYGQVADGCEAEACWTDAATRYDLPELQREVDEFNRQNKLKKKGLAVMPICFGISFTKKWMNQARALVHLYADGSVGVSTGAVEMGQGVNTKMVQVAARCLSVRPERIKIEPTNTTRIANTSPTAASATSDLNGKALQLACQALTERLLGVARARLQAEEVSIRNEVVWVGNKPSDLGWNDLILEAYQQRVCLSEHAHYATPGIHYDPTVEKGHPFAYHVYGTALVGTTVDCLRGTYTVDYVRVTHDFGQSMNTIVDRGQAEGAIVQGIGWMTMEDLRYNADGRLLSNALSTYKIPDIYSVPPVLDIHFLETAGSDYAIFRSKAVGEPPLMYGIGAYFALRNAVRAFNPSSNLPFDAPMTPEKVLLSLYADALVPTPEVAS
ncbi:molybdopterin-dependent oxidoreductase [Rudanella paleaurantiibacter]|uniref:Molybdopterin-dependent oxidoreductase n=1 Tax=Rudanella paleaurantiibacter TaxID=2614655 RepID=A0A7J5U0D8_9BACT|nr:molybdopterin cofactor-binding domain-containing protein [Rudanella paleaurantiibacter]KAB7731160.1 molybdopterin-dependent oxidoreductase [Rudanella paleaurantiibacter]